MLGPAQAGPTPIAFLRLTPIATGLDLPVALAPRAGDDALYVAEQPGRVTAIRDGAVDPTPVLDITGTVSLGLEQGLIGLAFDPADPDFLYINYTDLAGDTHVVEYQMDGSVADPGTRRELLFVDQPFANHNGGSLKFGPDGYLYIGLGDGGSAGDPQRNAQNMTTVLGKMLRIDPRGGSPYAVPSTNPFVSESGARGEIWAYGLRNPWQFSFDRATGDLWIGDVGQNLWEEIDFQPASSAGGENYGWHHMEGTRPYEGGVEPENHTPPIFEYPHGQGCSITGGFVYRGSAILGLQGAYVFSDFCAGRIWTLAQVGDLSLSLETGLIVPTISAFGEDNAGELYTTDLTGNVFRIDPLI
jgi:glucose/arabinose dehydrogenase